MSRDRVLTEILKTVAEKYDIHLADAELIHNSPYKFAKSIISELDITGSSYEEINAAKKNFTFPSLCKLYVNMNKLKILKEINEKRN